MSALPAVAAEGEAPGCASVIGRVVSRQGSVEIRRVGALAWQRVERLDTQVCDGDAVRTGVRSRAAVWLQPENLIRLDQRTAVTIVSNQAETKVEFFSSGQVSADPDCGAAYFISRFPRNFGVRTPFLSAAIKGTEFLVNAQCSSTTLAVFEGIVAAKELQTGREFKIETLQQISVGPGLPSSIPIPIKPRDGVQWTIYYPRTAARRMPGEEASFEQCPAGAAGEACQIANAEVLLATGAAREAEDVITRLRATGARGADLSALDAVIRIALNDREGALASARGALQAEPTNVRAWIALSYVRQAKLDLDGALDAAIRAAELDKSAFSDARVSEVLLSMGRIQESAKWAARAAVQDPNEARAFVVRGFVRLAQIRTTLATEDFLRAIELDSADPLGRVGLGLAKIRTGNLREGREDLEIAAALDPTNSLVRSYLGKAYSNEAIVARGALADSQLELARRLDPNDPTPSLYHALIKHATNRPVEALKDAENSIALNNNRAVYRSRLLLDEDYATRSASAARIYRDLGFDEMALESSAKSMSLDPLNYSAHAFLADYLTFQPRHEMARDSELLQAQLIQPLSLNPVQPRLAGNGTGFFDYSPVFATSVQEATRLLSSDGLALTLSGLGGGNQTGAGSAVLSGVNGKVSYSVGGFGSTTDGFRQNNDETRRVGNAYIQVAPTPQVGLQFEYRHLEAFLGDTQITFFDVNNFDQFVRDDFISDSARIGGRYDVSANSTVIASVIHREQTDDLRFSDIGYRSLVRENGNSAELRHIYRTDGWWLTSGLGHVWGDKDTTEVFPPDPTLLSTSKIGFDSAYVYGAKSVGAFLNIIAGASYNRYQLGSDDHEKTNPKLGVVWTPNEKTTVRAASFRSVKRSVVSSQTIEPTTVAGFNQFYSGVNDINGVPSRQNGLSIVHRVNDRLTIGAAVTHRVVMLNPDTGVQDDVDFTEDIAHAYLYWIPTSRMAVSASWVRENLAASKAVITPNLLLSSKTDRLPVALRYFSDSGAFASARVTVFRQEGEFADFSSFPIGFVPGNSNFSLLDLGIGYRSADRRAVVALEVRNVFDQRFDYQEINPQVSTIARDRVFLLRGHIQF